MPIGALSHIGIAKETTFGTAVAATDYIKFNSEGFDEEIEQIVSEAYNGVVDEGVTYEGAHTVKGEIAGEVYPNSIGHLLRSAFGAPTTTMIVAGVYQHVFTPTQANFSPVCALPPYTFEVNRDLEQAFQYIGCIVDELTFSFGADKDKILMASAKLLAKKLALITKTTPSFDVQNPFTWMQAAVTLNSVLNKDFSTLEFGVKNGLEGRETLDGTREVSRILRKEKRTFPIKFTMELDDLTEYNLFKAMTEVPLKIEFTGPIISGANNYKLTIDIPKFHFNSFPINVDGPGQQTVQVDGSAKYDASSLYGMKITLVNSKTSY